MKEDSRLILGIGAFALTTICVLAAITIVGHVGPLFALIIPAIISILAMMD